MTRRRLASAGVPPVLLVPALLGLLLLLLPLVGLLARAPWSTLPEQLARPEIRQALRLSLTCARLATLLCIVLGVPLAWLLARGPVRGRSLLRALVTVPLVLPPVVGGVALLLVLGRRGLVGRQLEELTGLSLPFTTAGVVLAEAFVALPFLVLAVEGALRGADPGLEEAASTLGAVPLDDHAAGHPAPGAARDRRRLGPGVGPALGEFGATITFAGSFPGRTQTVPLAVYQALETDPEAAVVLSLVLLVVSVGVLAVLRERWVGR